MVRSLGCGVGVAGIAEANPTTKLNDKTAPGQSRRSFNDAAAWLRVTLSFIGEGVITVDAHAKVTSVNRVAQALTGWTQEDATAGGGVPIQTVFNIINRTSRAKVESPTVQGAERGDHRRPGQPTIHVPYDRTGRTTRPAQPLAGGAPARPSR